MPRCKTLRALFVLVLVVTLVGSTPAPQSTHRVVVDAEGYYGIVGVDDDLPSGWRSVFEGTLPACVLHMAELLRALPESGPRGESAGGADGPGETYGLMFFNDANEVMIAGASNRIPVMLGKAEYDPNGPASIIVLVDPANVGDLRQYAVREEVTDEVGAVVAGAVAGAMVATEDATSGNADADADGLVTPISIHSLGVAVMDADFNSDEIFVCPNEVIAHLVRATDPHLWGQPARGGSDFTGWEGTGWDANATGNVEPQDVLLLIAHCAR